MVVPYVHRFAPNECPIAAGQATGVVRMMDNRAAAIAALKDAGELAELVTDDFLPVMLYQTAAAQVRATLWLGEMLADLTSAVRETGHK